MNKIFAIAWKELYTTFTDRNFLLIMILIPLLVASIIGSAFSGFASGGNDVPVRNIPLVIVNQDETVESNGVTSNYGQILVDLLVPTDPTAPDPEDNPLLQLTDARLMSEIEAARAGVDTGTYSVAIIVPPDFTRSMTYSQEQPDIRISPIEVYSSPAAPISAGIIRSIVENITSTFLSGNITVAATINALVAEAQQNPSFGLQFLQANRDGSFQPDFSRAFQPSTTSISIEQQAVTGQAATFNPLVTFGAAQALFFMTFTAIQGANSMLEERRAWTLQRLIATPTPRIMLLLGKLIGALVICIFQVVLLFFFLTLIGSLLAGQLQLIWGNNLLGVFAVIVAGSLAACGVGALITAIARSPEQVNIVGGVVAMFFGLFSGAFFDLRALGSLGSLGRLTPNYWAVDAFMRLAQGNYDIVINLVILLGIGVILFFAGLMLFNRRLSV